MRSQASTRPGALRSRRCRERKASRRASLRVEVDIFGLADALVEDGRLQQWDSEDSKKIALAVGRLLHEFVERVTRHAPDSAHPLGSSSEGDADVCDQTEGTGSGER